MAWDIIRIPWSEYRAAGTTEHLPNALLQVQQAATVQQAEQACWQIENTVVVQGALYEAAIPTVICLLGIIQRATDAARPFILELLVQIASGEPAEVSMESGHSRLNEQCMREIARGTAVYVDWLEYGTGTERLHCVDLLGLCSQRDRTLKERVRWLFQRVLHIEEDERVKEFLAYWITELAERTQR